MGALAVGGAVAEAGAAVAAAVLAAAQVVAAVAAACRAACTCSKGARRSDHEFEFISTSCMIFPRVRLLLALPHHAVCVFCAHRS